MTALVCWWHGKVLRHPQIAVINGETEPGVKCYCFFPLVMRATYFALVQLVPDSPLNQYRWFPSDGGRGR